MRVGSFSTYSLLVLGALSTLPWAVAVVSDALPADEVDAQEASETHAMSVELFQVKLHAKKEAAVVEKEVLECIALGRALSNRLLEVEADGSFGAPFGMPKAPTSCQPAARGAAVALDESGFRAVLKGSTGSCLEQETMHFTKRIAESMGLYVTSFFGLQDFVTNILCCVLAKQGYDPNSGAAYLRVLERSLQMAVMAPRGCGERWLTDPSKKQGMGLNELLPAASGAQQAELEVQVRGAIAAKGLVVLDEAGLQRVLQFHARGCAGATTAGPMLDRLIGRARLEDWVRGECHVSLIGPGGSTLAPPLATTPAPAVATTPAPPVATTTTASVPTPPPTASPTPPPTPP